MKKTIYNTYVVMESQEQCDRMKQLCIDNGLKCGYAPLSFEFFDPCIFEFDSSSNDFYIVVDWVREQQIQITEQEFIELLEKQL